MFKGRITWHFAASRETINGETEYSVREVYLNSEGEVAAWTENPITISGDSVEDLLLTLEMIKQDITKHPVLDIDAEEGR